MPDVFILGAGFSKAVHSSMPLLTELSVKVREQLERDGKLPPPLLNLGDNVELWLTYLSQPQPWLKEYDNLQNRALFLRMTETIGKVLHTSTIETVSRGCPDWLRDLVQRWDNDKSSVITFNYDTLIERAALTFDIVPQHIYPVPLTSVRRVPEWGSDPKKSFRLFKLHGSANWYYSGAESFYGEVLYYGHVAPWGEASNEVERESTLAASDKVSLVVPPTTEKVRYFQHETLRQIWCKASEALSAAAHIYCVGYSLPLTDLGIRFFLQHSRPMQKVSFQIVNKDQTLVEHYKKLLGNSYNIDGQYSTTGVADWINST